MPSDLKPIRIDVTSPDGSVHLVDTFLLDPFCLPVASSSSSSSWRCLPSSCEEIAINLLADVEVCTTRTSGSKSHLSGGRIHLQQRPSSMSLDKDRENDDSLHTRMTQQLYDQLHWYITELQEGRDTTMAFPNSIKTVDAESISLSNPSATVGKLPVSSKSSGVEPKTPESTPALDHFADSPQPKYSSIDNFVQNSTYPIVPIHIEIREGNIVVKDSFDYDLCLFFREFGDPVSIANQIAKDLNLPQSFAVSIAISIVEQLNGLVDLDRASSRWKKRAIDQTTGAWILDSKDATNMDTFMMLNSGTSNKKPKNNNLP